MKRIIRLLLVLGSMLAIAVVAIGYTAQQMLSDPLPLAEPVTFQIEQGDGLSRVLYRFEQQGWLGDGHTGTARRLAARVQSKLTGQDTQLHVGEYVIRPGESLTQVLQKATAGEVVQRSLTLVEGWHFREVKAYLASRNDLTHTLAEQTDAQIMAALGAEGVHPEGQFAPDTYFYTYGTRDLDILQRAFERQQGLLAEAWEQKQADIPLTSPYEALILASIVEKETGVAYERPEIAGVFTNRLRKGMRLQTDPTVIYGMGEAYDGNIRRRDLRTPTPYNTYVISGLPPTPIAMPGKEALLAAVQPAQTSAIYFVARGDGSHYFSQTLAQHQQAVRKYQLQRREGYRSSPGGAQ